MDLRQSTRSDLDQQMQDVPETCTANKDTPVISITPAKAYFQVFLAFCVMCFGNLPFYTIVGLQSSLNGALGLAPSALYHVTWIAGCLLTQTLVAALGLKATLVFGAAFTSAYALGFYHPAWALLTVTSAVAGFADGPLISVPNVYANIMACSLARARGRDIKYYVGVFQGVVGSAGLLGGAVLGNAASSAIFLVDEYLSGLAPASAGPNGTHSMWRNESSSLQNVSTWMQGGAVVGGNATTTGNETALGGGGGGACMLESTAREVSTGAYYTLLAVATLSSAISCVCALLLVHIPERSFTCMPVRKLASIFAHNLVGTAKMLKVPKYMLVMGLALYSGLEAAFVLSFFTKYFVTDCLGIGYVGASVMLFSVCTSAAGIASGKAMAYTSRTLYSAFALLWTVTLCVFMVVWEKEHSFAAVLVLAAGLGVSNGQWTTLGTAYLGVLGSKESERVFGLFWSARGIGGTASFVIAIFISSTTVFALILLGTLLIGYFLYLIGEISFGEKLRFCRRLYQRMRCFSHSHGVYDLGNSAKSQKFRKLSKPEGNFQEKHHFGHKLCKQSCCFHTPYGNYDLDDSAPSRELL